MPGRSAGRGPVRVEARRLHVDAHQRCLLNRRGNHHQLFRGGDQPIAQRFLCRLLRDGIQGGFSRILLAAVRLWFSRSTEGRLSDTRLRHSLGSRSGPPSLPRRGSSWYVRPTLPTLAPRLRGSPCCKPLLSKLLCHNRRSGAPDRWGDCRTSVGRTVVNWRHVVGASSEVSEVGA